MTPNEIPTNPEDKPGDHPVVAFEIELLALIARFTDEWRIDVTQIIGVLEYTKFNLCTRIKATAEEDEE